MVATDLIIAATAAAATPAILQRFAGNIPGGAAGAVAIGVGGVFLGSKISNSYAKAAAIGLSVGIGLTGIMGLVMKPQITAGV